MGHDLAMHGEAEDETMVAPGQQTASRMCVQVGLITIIIKRDQNYDAWVNPKLHAFSVADGGALRPFSPPRRRAPRAR